MESASNKIRLSAMMFGLYLVVGSWAVTLATYLISSPLLGGMAFSPNRVSWVYNTWAFGGMCSPIFIGLLADRLFPVQRLLAFFSIAGAGLLIGVGFWCEREQAAIEAVYREATADIRIDGRPLLEVQEQNVRRPATLPIDQKRQLIERQNAIRELPAMVAASDHAFYPLLAMMFAYCFCCVMTIGCSNVMGFRNLKEPQKHYGRIRLCGTVGWIVAGLTIAFTGKAISHYPLYFAAGTSVVMGIYYLTLPHTPPLGNGKTLGEAFGLPALKLLRERPFRILVSGAFMMSVIQQFYGVYANKFLTDLRVPMPTAMQTLAQVGEVICMAFLPAVVDRFGLRRTILVGLMGWTARNALFATGTMPVVAYVALPLHGLCFTFFFVTAMVYVDRQAPRVLRASTQGIFTFLSSGMGVLAGNMLSAWVVRLNSNGDGIDWTPVWIVPTLMSAGVFVYFFVGFRPRLDAVPMEEGEASRHMVERIEEISGSGDIKTPAVNPMRERTDHVAEPR